MKKTTLVLLATCWALSGCDSDADEEKSEEQQPGPGGSGGSETDGATGQQAQRLGANLFHAVFQTLWFNAIQKVPKLAAGGESSTEDCLGWAANPSGAYGEVTLGFEEGGSTHTYAAAFDLTGCLALESGTNEAFSFKAHDLSGDGTTETFVLDGRLAAVTFDEGGLAPAPEAYDADAEPTCTDVFFDGVHIESPGFDAEGNFSNESTSHSPSGYTAGTLSALCGGFRLRCELAGGKTPVGLFNLDAVADSVGRGSVCVLQAKG